MVATSRTQEHVGEWKLTISADSLDDLFREAARVVARAIGPTQGEVGEPQHVSLAARDTATLLADWMNELIGRSEVDGVAYDDVRVVVIESQDGSTLDAEIRGRIVRAWQSPLKAVTYHGLALTSVNDKLRATLVIDV
ncbi:MAG TPA: archease [Gemmatimonadaceae bacterium]